MSNSLHDDKTVILKTDSEGGEKKEPEKAEKRAIIKKEKVDETTIAKKKGHKQKKTVDSDCTVRKRMSFDSGEKTERKKNIVAGKMVSSATSSERVGKENEAKESAVDDDITDQIQLDKGKLDTKNEVEMRGESVDTTDEVVVDVEGVDTTDEVEVDVEDVDTTDEVEVDVESVDTTDEVQINNGDMDVTDETEAVVDSEEKTQLLKDVKGSEEKTDQYHGGESRGMADELDDVGELNEKTAEDVCAIKENAGEGVGIHEEATRLLNKASYETAEMKGGETGKPDEATRVQKQTLSSEDVWHRSCEKKRSKYLWLVAVVPLFLTIILVAWMKSSTGHVDVMTWLWALFIVFVGLGFGLFIWFGCSGWTINCNDDKFESWWGVFGPLFKRNLPLGKFSAVVLEPDEKVLSGAFVVCLSTRSPDDFKRTYRDENYHDKSEQVMLSPRGAILDYPTALRGARQIAIFLQLPIVDQSTGGALVREVDTFNRSVLDKWKKQGIKPEKQSVPPSLRAVFRRAKESVVLGRKTGEQAIVWEVVFSKEHLVVEGKGFEVDNIEKIFIDDSPVLGISGRVDEAVVSGIHVFSGRNSAVFCKRSTRKEAEFVFSAIRSIFLGGSISEILGEVLAKKPKTSGSIKSSNSLKS